MERTISKIYLFIMCVFALGLLFGFFIGLAVSPQLSKPIENVATVDECSRDTLNWEVFIEALAYVESGNSTTAVGTKNDVGLLQITPILIKDANRILGDEVYSLSDRTDSLKSIEIFNVVQEYYNEEKSPHKALKVWNPKSKLSYHNNVMNKYNELNNK